MGTYTKTLEVDYMQFQFGIPSQVIFGAGCSRQIGEVVQGFNAQKVFCVYDQGVKAAGIVEQIVGALKAANIDVVEYDGVLPNPPETVVEEGAKFALEANVEAIVAVGGGSSIDAAKAINILLTNPGPINRYDGLNKVEIPTKPLIAIPTTSGTASEVTGVTVVTNTVEKRKMVLAGKNIGADLALVDPELTMALPPAVTAATGMDALTHAIEAYTSKFASIPADVNALKAIELIYNNIEAAYNDGNNLEARTNMLLGSMLAGYAFNSAFLGLVHAIAHPLSAHCGLPHGVANACGLPFVMEYNSKDPNVQQKYSEIAKAMGLDVDGLSAEEGCQKAVEAVKNLANALDIPNLEKLGVRRDQLELLAEETLKEEVSMWATPVDATKEDVLRLLERAY